MSYCTVPNLTPIDEAFGLHFRNNYADMPDTKIKKLEQRIAELETKVAALEEIIKSKLNNDQPQSLFTSWLDIFTPVKNLFCSKLIHEPSEPITEVKECPPSHKNNPVDRTGKIPPKDMNAMLENIMMARENQDIENYCKHNEDDAMKKFNNFNNERNNEINKIYDDIVINREF